MANTFFLHTTQLTKMEDSASWEYSLTCLMIYLLNFTTPYNIQHRVKLLWNLKGAGVIFKKYTNKKHKFCMKIYKLGKTTDYLT